MAFSGKLGGLIRQTMSQGIASNGQGSLSSMLNSVRYMSGSKLFIGGLSYGTGDQELKEAFSSFGDVTEARVITDRDTGRSRGFGFVNFSSDDCASSALSGMDGQDLAGRNIRVSYANEKPPRGGGFGGGGGGGGDGYGRTGGYGGGGGRREDDF